MDYLIWMYHVIAAFIRWQYRNPDIEVLGIVKYQMNQGRSHGTFIFNRAISFWSCWTLVVLIEQRNKLCGKILETSTNRHRVTTKENFRSVRIFLSKDCLCAIFLSWRLNPHIAGQTILLKQKLKLFLSGFGISINRVLFLT